MKELFLNPAFQAAVGPVLLLILSELLPFLPNRYNGIAHALVDLLKAVVTKRAPAPKVVEIDKDAEEK